MKMTIKATLACLIAKCLLLGEATPATAKRDDSGSLPVTVHFAPPFFCEISFADQTFSLPDDQDRMATALKVLRRRWRTILFSSPTPTPYRCIGHAIFLAQRSGFRKVGFIAPPEG
jgi:hypothetical protein